MNVSMTLIFFKMFEKCQEIPKSNSLLSFEVSELCFLSKSAHPPLQTPVPKF